MGLLVLSAHPGGVCGQAGHRRR